MTTVASPAEEDGKWADVGMMAEYIVFSEDSCGSPADLYISEVFGLYSENEVPLLEKTHAAVGKLENLVFLLAAMSADTDIEVPEKAYAFAKAHHTDTFDYKRAYRKAVTTE